MLPFALPFLAMLAGTAIQSYGQNQALKKQQGIMLRSQREQIDARNQATQVAAQRASEFDPTQRQDRQDEITQSLEGQFNEASQGTPITAQGVQVGSTIPGASATGDYLAATAREKAKSTASLRDLASLMGRIGSAGQLRRDEAVGIGDTAGQIGRIQGNANNMAEIGTMEANAVTPSLGSQLLGGALSAYGATTLGNSGLGGVSAPGKIYSTSFANPDMRDLVQFGKKPWNSGT